MAKAKIIVMGGEKGGAGKSTNACNLAVILRLLGFRVLLIDADNPQHTATKWAKRRVKAGHQPMIEVEQQSGDMIGPMLELKAENYDYIIVDTRGADSEELRGAMLVADVLVSPIQPSQADIETLEDLAPHVHMIRSVNKKLKVLLLANAASTHASRPPSATLEDIQGFLTSDEYSPELRKLLSCFTLMTTVVSYRQVFRDAHKLGVSVVELAGKEINEKANAEMESLAKEIMEYASA